MHTQKKYRIKLQIKNPDKSVRPKKGKVVKKPAAESAFNSDSTENQEELVECTRSAIESKYLLNKISFIHKDLIFVFNSLEHNFTL